MDIREVAARFPPRSRQLLALLDERILIMDGAFGTQVQARGLSAADFGGEAFEGCNEVLVRTQPGVVTRIHEDYFAAGADMVETNTFGGTPLVLGEYGLAAEARELAAAASRLARQAAEKFSTPERPRFVAGACGPTTKSLSVTGGVTFAELSAHYEAQVRGLVEGGVDVLLFETALDTLNLKAALCAADRVFAETKIELPVMVSITIENFGTMLAGQDLEAACVSLLHRPLLSFGMNCSTGPEFMTDHLRALAHLTPTATSCIPNAGLPDPDGVYHLTPEAFAAKLREFAQQGWLNIAGGCCGTTPEHIRALAEALRALPPRRPPAAARTFISGLEALEVSDENRPYFVGERTNSLGSRAFKKLIAEGKYEEAAEIGRRQVRAGAHVLDVCLQNPDRDEAADVAQFLDQLVRKIKAPLMLDTTDERVLELALQRVQGKIIYNSVNLEDGEERFRKVVPLVRQFGAALVVGCIDEDKQAGMAVTRQRKLAIAERSHALLTEKYGLPETDLIFDALVFPAGSGDRAYAGSARETIEGLRLIKQRFPRSRTTLGISNVSFGLPPAGREVLNSVFLHHCVEAGLDLPIVNTEKLARYAQISEADKRLCEDLIDNRGPDPVAAFAAQFRERKESGPRPDARAKLPIRERLARNVVEGTKEGLLADLDELLKTVPALDIVNGPLLAGMDEVGRLFNANEMIVAEVLQSAEVMKAAVTHLEPHMPKSGAALRGKFVLATVKGDVHDIGKTLVEIIFSNNGYRVIDLGIKVPPERLIEACREHQPDLIGLSGLLVKSAQQMALTAADLRAAGIATPLLVGGAALSDRFTRTRIGPAYGAPVLYARDAMSGLDLANQTRDPARFRALCAERCAGFAGSAVPAPEAATPPVPAPSGTAGVGTIGRLERVVIDHSPPSPVPPDLRRHVLDDHGVYDIFPWVNPLMIYGRHLGLKGNIEKLLAAGDPKAREVKALVERMLERIQREHLFAPRAVYQFFPALSADDTLYLLRQPAPPKGERPAPGEVLAAFHFPRQSDDKGWCAPDFVRSAADGRARGLLDYVALFVTTCGHGVRARAEEYKQAGRYVESITLQALALECAEGFAEWLHSHLRALWGFPDAPEMTMVQRFQARYRGIRLSFGYPACPRLEDQRTLFRALNVEKEIGVRLTDEFMMDPEASVSAVVFQHPQARYFSVSEGDLRRFEEHEDA